MEDGADVSDGSDANSISTSTSTFSSALSSSDLDTESTTSFLQERSITLGSLIGIAGDAILANDDHVPFHDSGDRVTPMHATRSSQRLSFTHTTRVRGRAKLCRLLVCGACKGLCYTNKGTFKVFCCAKNGNNHVGPPATAPLSSSLGHLLVAERDEERSLERDAIGSSSGARVYINIMYEENAGVGQVAINPLFDLHSMSIREVGSTVSSDQGLERCIRDQNSSSELSLASSFCAEDELHGMLVERMSTTDSMSAHALAAAGPPPSLPPPSLTVKGQKGLSTSLCPLGRVSMGCISYMWTRCRI